MESRRGSGPRCCDRSKTRLAPRAAASPHPPAGARCGFVTACICLGPTHPGIGQAAIAVVPIEKSGMGSGINTTFRQVGIATGVAGLGAVFQSQVDSKLAAELPEVPAGLGEAVASGGSRGAAEMGFHGGAVRAADVAFVSGMNEILV